MKTKLKTLPFLLLLLLVACHQPKEDIIVKPGNIEAAISIRNCTSLKLSNIFQPASNIVLGNINLKSATIIQYTIKGRFMSR